MVNMNGTIDKDPVRISKGNYQAGKGVCFDLSDFSSN